MEINYILRLVAVPLLLIWAWGWYIPLTGPKNKIISIIYGIGFGIFGLIIWCLLLAPFVEIKGEPWANAAFSLRLISASLVVPVFEEIVMRGYIFRLALQWDMARKNKITNPLGHALDNSNIGDIRPGAWSGAAILISTLAFTIGHTAIEWPAAIAYGLLICLLWIIRKDLISCITAHATTNLLLGLYVYQTSHWGFW